MFYLMFWRSWKHILAFSQFLIKILEIPKFWGTPFNFWWRQHNFLCQWLYFGLFYISAKFYWQQTSITRDIEGGGWISPPGPEEPLKSPVHIGLKTSMDCLEWHVPLEFKVYIIFWVCEYNHGDANHILLLTYFKSLFCFNSVFPFFNLAQPNK